MKEKVLVSMVQFAPKWLDREHNALRMKRFAEEEAQKGAELIVFPELANIGYVTPAVPGKPASFAPDVTANEFAVRYIEAAETIPGPTTETLGEVARRYGVYIVVGLAQAHPVVPGTLYNSAALIGPSGVIGVHHKMHLPLNEKQFFYPGNTAEVYATDIGNIGMNVCYDGRFPELSRVLALQGAEIICSIWAMPGSAMAALADLESLKHRAYTRAQENGLYFLACSRTGKEGDTEFIGHSAVAGPNGNVIAFSETAEEEVLHAELYHKEIIKYRALLSIFRDRRPEMYSLITEPLSQPYRAPAAGKVFIEQPPAPSQP